MTIAVNDLPAILVEHGMWLCGEGGKCAYLRGTDLTNANLRGANLTGAYLRGTDLTNANLTNANLTGAYLRGANLTNANLRGADLTGAYLGGADLTNANLRGANLTEAKLRGADLGGANLTEAKLRGADLGGANLGCANLGGANLWGVKAKAAPLRRVTRSDGYEFLLWDTDRGWRIRAGCRFFALDEADAHWSETRPRGTPLGDETHDILDFFRAHIARVS